MKRIEYFCRNIRHSDSIEEQMEEAKMGGIIKSYTLTTLSAMNARRNADICLWCDEIWSADHIHSCLCVPDHNCMFTCGEDFEVFAFVKVSKEGLKPLIVDNSEVEALVHCAEKVFDEICKPNSCVPREGTTVSVAHKVFDKIPEPNLCSNQLEKVPMSECNLLPNAQSKSAQKVLDGLPVPSFILEMAKAAKVAELDSLQGDGEPALDVVLFEKSMQLPSCIVQVWRSSIRLKTNFSYLRNFNGWQYSNKVHQLRDNLLAGNLYLERQHPHMASKPFYILNTMHFSKRRLLLNASDSVITLILPMILGVQACNTSVFESKMGWRAFLTFKELYSWGIRPLGCDWPCLKLSLGRQMFLLRLHLGYNQIDYMSSYILIYDPGDLVFGAAPSSIIFVFIEWNTRPWFSTLEDKGVFRGEADTNGKCTWKLLNHLRLWSKYNASKTNICFVLFSYIFDPGGFTFCVGQISMVVLDDWFMMRLLFSLKSDFTYPMVIFALIPVLEYDDGYLSEYAAAYSLPYDIIMHDSVIIFNQAANVHPHMVRFYLQFPTFYKLEMSRLLLGFSHLCFNIICCKFSASRVAINWEFKEVLYMFEQHYTANMCILLDFSHKSAIWSTWRGQIVCFDSVLVTRDLAQGVKDVPWRNTLQQIGSDRGDAFRLAGNISFLTEMTWMKNCATSSHEFLMEVTSSFFIFDPGGNDDSLRGETCGIRSVTYEVAKAKTMLKWEAGMLLENGKHNISDSTFVFDPGGIGGMKGIDIMFYCVTQVSLLQKCPYIFTLADIIWVFDPGGIRRFNECRYWIGFPKCNATQIVNSSKSTSLKIMLGCRSRMFALTLEDKGDLKGWEVIHTKNIIEGTLVI